MRSYVSFSDELSTILKEKDPDFVQVMNHPGFSSLWMTRNPDLLLFVKKNLNELLKGAFISTPKERILSNHCIQVLRAKDVKMQSIFIREPGYKSFFVEYPKDLQKYTLDSQQKYFQYLPEVMFSPKLSLNPEFAHIEFFKRLIDSITMEQPYYFLLSLFSSPPSSIKKFFKKTKELCKLLVRIMNNTKQERKRSQQLFMKALNSKMAPDASIALLGNDALVVLIRNAVEAREVETIDFVYFLAIHSSHIHFSGSWKKVNTIIFKFIPDFCSIVCNENGYNQMSNSCMNIIILSISTITPDLHKVYTKIGNEFFTLHTNSFCHNAFINLLKTLINKHLLSEAMINELNLYKNIIKCYDEIGEDVLSSYWGHIRLMSTMLNSFARKDKELDKLEWKKVITINQQKNQIISKAYGGSKPLFQKPQQRNDFMFFSIALIALVAITILVIISYYT